MTIAPDSATRRRSIFLKIHSGLPREGPGDSASTLRAYRCASDLPTTARILDVGCGPGAQTIDLASVTAGGIVALDTHRPYLDELEARVRLAGLPGRILAVQASMFAMPFQREAFDVVWAEGTIYVLGLDRALTEWRTLLRPSGYLAATHLSWLVTDVPSQPRAFWELNYPAIRHVDENVAICGRSGFHVVDRFTLPESAWWIDYYGPMEARLIGLREECAGDDEAMAVITAAGEEIDLYRRFSASYGYVFYILRVKAS